MLLSAICGYTQTLTSRLKAERMNEKRDREREVLFKNGI
jgi:hypothetical protein